MNNRDIDVANIKKIASIILDPSDDWGKKEIAVASLHKILSGITGIRGAIKDRDEGFETALKAGLALSPGYAADCTLDTKRTVKYIQALDQAIRSMKTRLPGRPINVVYAGTGPFAPFAIPLAFVHGSEEARFTALDIHRESLASLRKIVEALGLEEHFNELVECDATEYRHHGKYPLHVLVTETMHRTLSREPHVMITLNLARQLAEGGIVVPESVRIEAVLSEIGQEVKYLDYKVSEGEIRGTRLSLGTVFELSKETRFDFEGGKLLIEGPVKDIDFDIGSRKLLVLLTEIKLCEGIELGEKESGITHPYFVQELGNVRRGDRIKFDFNLSQFPKMICSKVEEKLDPLAALEKL
jgi:hypothetical protein